MTNILEMRSVRKSFGSVHALRGVDFSLAEGEITALLGDNGAGKSTLAKIIAGLYAPSSGSVLIGGAPVTQEWVTEAGADSFGENAGVAVKVLEQVMAKKA